MCLLCILYNTRHITSTSKQHQHQQHSDPIAIRLDATPCDTTRCTARDNGALTLPAARVKHQEQAAVTGMTVSDEVDSCGSTSRELVLAWRACVPVLAGQLGLAWLASRLDGLRVWVGDNVWLRCYDDRCTPSTATSKRHPNPADQCKSILYPRLEVSCWPRRCCRALAALLLAVPCCTLHPVCSALLLSSPARPVVHSQLGNTGTPRGSLQRRTHGTGGAVVLHNCGTLRVFREWSGFPRTAIVA